MATPAPIVMDSLGKLAYTGGELCLGMMGSEIASFGDNKEVCRRLHVAIGCYGAVKLLFGRC